MPVTTGLLARLINEALGEEEIRDLAFDGYRPVYNQYSAAMSRTEQIRRLVDWCARHRRLDELLERVARINPERAAAYAERFADHTGPTASHREPFIAHPLPPAADFVGRADDLRALEDFWDREGGGLFCLVALGGAGKTTMVAEFLRRLRQREDDRPHATLVWSFYDNPDAQSFLAAAQAYFAPDEQFAALNPGGALYLLMRALESSGRNLLVLDGLERVQRTHGGDGLLGEIADQTLSQFVRRLAAGLGRTRAVITTRVAVPRLEPWLDRTCWVRDVASLTPDDACELLARNGVAGDRQALLGLVETFGAHALTLDHLGGYLRSFHGGRPEQADRLVMPVLEAADVQEHRLARVFNAYATAMGEQELALLSRLCVYRYGMTVPALHAVFATSSDERVAGPLAGLSEGDFERVVSRLARLHLVQADRDRWTVHPAVRDYFYLRFEQAGVVHDAVRRQYATLVAAPGTGLPRDEAELDGLEELVHHTLRVGRVDDAEQIFVGRLGGVEHLGWNLGQYSRCIRVLREFPHCPDTAGLLWCHRAVGDLAAAERLVAPDDLWWLGMLGCLRGRLAEVVERLAGGHDDVILTVCQVLTGAADVRQLAAAPVWPGLPLTVADAWLALDRPAEAEAAASELARHVAGRRGRWSDELARVDLTLAEVARRRGDTGRCGALLDKAGLWVLKSGSQEHLCQWNLLQGRLALDLGRHADAATALEQGTYTAEHCGFGLSHIDLRIESARLALALGEHRAAAAHAGAALVDARDSRCGYLSGARRAEALLRQAEVAVDQSGG